MTRFGRQPEERAPRVVWQFTREQVEQQDFAAFLFQFGEIPDGAFLKDAFQTFSVGVGGYDDDPRELSEIPEVRAFFAKFYEVWPHWLYFIDTRSLSTIVYCILKTYRCVREDKRKYVKHFVESEEMAEFIERQTPDFINLCHRAGIDSIDANERLHNIANQLRPRGDVGRE